MSFAPMNFGDISPRVGLYAVAKFLDNAQPQLCLENWGMVTALPKNKGLNIKWRRAVPFDVSTTALTEGVTPAPQILEYEDVSTSISQYGAWVPFTDVINDIHEDPVLNSITDECSKQAASTKEAIIWGVLRAGTAIVYSGSATSRASVQAPISLDEIRASVRDLKGNHARKITKILSASQNIATEPVNASFLGVGHTNMERDFREMASFVPIEKYGSFKPLHENEIGKVEEVRIVLTPHLEPFYGLGSTTTTGVLNNGTAVDVYAFVIFGEDAYGVTPLKGMESVALGVKNPEMAASYEDPLGQRGFVSWKMWFVAVRLNENWMVRVEAAVTSL